MGPIRLLSLPFGGGAEAPWYGWAIFLLGCVLLFVTILLTNTAVSRTVYMNLKGETFYTWKEAYKFAFKNLGSILGAPLAIAGVILLFVIAAIIMGLIGRRRIPVRHVIQLDRNHRKTRWLG